MSHGKHPVSAPAMGESSTYVSDSGASVTITADAPSHWSVASDAFMGEIVRDGDVFHARYTVASGPHAVALTLDSWADVIERVFR